MIMKKEVEKRNLGFKTNPEKSANRVSINSFMMGSLFFILTLILTLSPEKFNMVILSQLVLAIPLLFVSSLAYSKIGYWKDTKHWDTFGWFTNNLGSIFILNVVGLITATFSKNLAFAYFGLTLILMLIYSSINVLNNPSNLKEKTFKFLFFVAILFLGGIMHLI